MRRLALATLLATTMGVAGATLATASPTSMPASRLTCVVVRPADESLCVSVPKLPDTPKLPNPPLP